MKRMSVQPEWCLDLPLQQQSVLLLAARGPDGIAKRHPSKNVVRAYRGTVLCAAARKRPLAYGERADSFMSLDRFAEEDLWKEDVEIFLDNVDSIPHHYFMHLLHGAEILGAHHPEPRFQRRWQYFYIEGCDDMHVNPESWSQLNVRLNDVFGEDHEVKDPHRA